MVYFSLSSLLTCEQPESGKKKKKKWVLYKYHDGNASLFFFYFSQAFLLVFAHYTRLVVWGHEFLNGEGWKNDSDTMKHLE